MTDELLNYVLSAVDLTETLRNLIKSTYSAINNYLNSLQTLKFLNGGSVQDTEEADITIGGKSYTVEIVDTPESLLKGLKGRESLAKNRGMLFDFNEGGNHEMWMKDTLIPLDLIFLDENLKVIKVVTRQPKDETLVGCDGTWYVLEVNANSGIKKGDTLDFEDEQQEDWVMQVLAPDGSSLMNLQGGERIVSRRETKVLIRKAKKANKRKTDGAYASLGKYMFKILEGQDTRDPEYVKAPTQS